MRIIIIEDERLTAEDLSESILQLDPSISEIVQLRSVKEAIAYFKNNVMPDLIFSDIQLGDGLSFEIFAAVDITAPIIFCTAYDEYLLDAFKTNGIDYILKPFTKDLLEIAFNKYKKLKQKMEGNLKQQYDAILKIFTEKLPSKTEAILVYYQDKIMPVKLNDIALFYIENEICHLLTFSDKVYYPNKNLDELEKISGTDFFRLNRQFLVNRKAVVDASSYFSRKLLVNLSVSFSEPITVSKERTPLFLRWLTGTN